MKEDGEILKQEKTKASGQEYFWTGEWRKDESEADKDIKAGSVSKRKNAKDMIQKLKAENSKRAGKRM